MVVNQSGRGTLGVFPLPHIQLERVIVRDSIRHVRGNGILLGDAVNPCVGGGGLCPRSRKEAAEEANRGEDQNPAIHLFLPHSALWIASNEGLDCGAALSFRLSMRANDILPHRRWHDERFGIMHDQRGEVTRWTLDYSFASLA